MPTTTIKYRETVDPKSPAIVLLAPSGSPHPFYAQFGWTNAAGGKVKVPDDNTIWTQQGSGALGVGKPITLTWDNGEGLEFRRVINEAKALSERGAVKNPEDFI